MKKFWKTIETLIFPFSYAVYFITFYFTYLYVFLFFSPFFHQWFRCNQWKRSHEYELTGSFVVSINRLIRNRYRPWETKYFRLIAYKLFNTDCYFTFIHAEFIYIRRTRDQCVWIISAIEISSTVTFPTSNCY